MRTLNALTASVCSGGKDHRTITVLDAKGRNFAELDDISELQLLKRVVLDNNEITSLAGLKDNTDLESVSARNNAISEVNPADMAGWTRLVFLDLSHNKLTQLEVTDPPGLGWSPSALTRSRARLCRDSNIYVPCSSITMPFAPCRNWPGCLL